MWAGIAIAAMWIAVLFIGLFGGDFVSNGGANNVGSSTTIPAAVFVALFALLGTVPLARRGFAGDRDSDDLRAALDEERRARVELAAEVDRLREKVG